LDFGRGNPATVEGAWSTLPFSQFYGCIGYNLPTIMFAKWSGGDILETLGHSHVVLLQAQMGGNWQGEEFGSTCLR